MWDETNGVLTTQGRGDLHTPRLPESSPANFLFALLCAVFSPNIVYGTDVTPQLDASKMARMSKYAVVATLRLSDTYQLQRQMDCLYQTVGTCECIDSRHAATPPSSSPLENANDPVGGRCGVYSQIFADDVLVFSPTCSVDDAESVRLNVVPAIP